MEQWQLPEGWEWVRLDEISETVGGFGFPKRFQGHTGLSYPFIKVSDMNRPGNEVIITQAANTVDEEMLGRIGARVYPEGTVIFPKIGGAIATNKVRILGKKATFDNNVMGLVIDTSRTMIKWGYHYLCSQNLMDLAKMGPVPSIRQSAVQSLLIPLPWPDDPTRSLETQRRIVARIEALFADLRAARELHETIVEDTDRLMDAVLAEVFDAASTREWANEKALGDLIEINAPLVDPTLSKYRDLPHIHGQVIEEGIGRLSPYRTATEDGMRSGKYLFEPGSVLYSKIRPYLRKVTTVDFEGLCSADIYPLELKTDEIEAEFLMWALLSPGFTDYANSLSGRARMPKLNREQLFAYSLRFPNRLVQASFSHHLSSVRDEIVQIKRTGSKSATELAETEQAILAQAFRGEL